MNARSVNPLTDLLALIRQALLEVLAGRQLDRPAPYPIAVGVDKAAELISVSPDTIWTLVNNGTLRTLDLGGVNRTLIPTLALFELDPAVRNQMRLVVIDSAADDPADRPGDAA